MRDCDRYFCCGEVGKNGSYRISEEEKRREEMKLKDCRTPIPGSNSNWDDKTEYSFKEVIELLNTLYAEFGDVDLVKGDQRKVEICLDGIEDCISSIYDIHALKDGRFHPFLGKDGIRKREVA